MEMAEVCSATNNKKLLIEKTEKGSDGEDEEGGDTMADLPIILARLRTTLAKEGIGAPNYAQPDCSSSDCSHFVDEKGCGDAKDRKRSKGPLSPKDSHSRRTSFPVYMDGQHIPFNSDDKFEDTDAIDALRTPHSPPHPQRITTLLGMSRCSRNPSCPVSRDPRLVHNPRNPSYSPSRDPVNRILIAPLLSGATAAAPRAVLSSLPQSRDPLAGPPQDIIDAAIVEENLDPCGPYRVHDRVLTIVQRWGPVTPIPPDQFLVKILQGRKYDASFIPNGSVEFKRKPSPKQVQDYDNELVWAVRNSNLEKLRTLHEQGRSMSACNRFSESIVHMACRRAEFDVVEYILTNGGDFNIVDDYGRTPLHDACWRLEPRFDVVTLLLDRNLELLRILDTRGSNPLKYVREEHWLHWCAYFFHQKDKYWPPR